MLKLEYSGRTGPIPINKAYRVARSLATIESIMWNKGSTACVISLWTNDRKCNYIFIFLLINSTLQSLNGSLTGHQHIGIISVCGFETHTHTHTHRHTQRHRDRHRQTHTHHTYTHKYIYEYKSRVQEWFIMRFRWHIFTQFACTVVFRIRLNSTWLCIEYLCRENSSHICATNPSISLVVPGDVAWDQENCARPK